MDLFTAAILLTWIIVAFLTFFLRESDGRRYIGMALPVLGAYALHHWEYLFVPWQLFFMGTFGLWVLLKGTLLLQYPQEVLNNVFSKKGILLYLTLWPGMDLKPFRRDLSDRLEYVPTTFAAGRVFRAGFFCFWLGVLLLSLILFLAPYLPGQWVAWGSILSIAIMVCMGYNALISVWMRFAGYPVTVLSNFPIYSKSLRDFWNHRWNLAYVELGQTLLLRPARRALGRRGTLLGVFLVIGVLHELAISNSVQAGWGLPTLFFVVQGLVITVERAWIKAEFTWSNKLVRYWTWTWIFFLLPLLFHGAFRHQLVEPLAMTAHKSLFLPGIWSCLLILAIVLQVALGLTGFFWPKGKGIRFPMTRIGSLIALGTSAVTLMGYPLLIEGSWGSVALAAGLGLWWGLAYWSHQAVVTAPHWGSEPARNSLQLVFLMLAMGLVFIYGGLMIRHSLLLFLG